ncbi:type II-A CRISPR-associated protein Csn2 [Pseudostreptobacillus hongkongensis]|uniref:type II-A CRISPR-associated protein Csn2 n=1 Tax=Pseudostreptobacillus hongkongensis TaxID=1162717 RepID=UPI0028D7570E|nr:type II-A CRISPR-associated protein Csn2 [Pseudostreptobacillus hongkongensis]
MIFQYKEFEFVIDFCNNSVNTLIVENKKEFRNLIFELINNLDSDEGNIILSENNEILTPIDKLFVFNNYFEFDINKIVLTKYYKMLKSESERLFFQETLELKGKIREYLEKITSESFLSLSINEEIDLSHLFKGCNLKFESNNDILSNVMEWLKIINEILGFNTFILISLRNILDKEELENLFKFIEYNEFKVIFIESNEVEKINGSDKFIIIDNNLCEIY